jgi:hypothetical protein
VLAKHLKGAQNVHGASKSDFLRNDQYMFSEQ